MNFLGPLKSWDELFDELVCLVSFVSSSHCHIGLTQWQRWCAAVGFQRSHWSVSSMKRGEPRGRRFWLSECYRARESSRAWWVSTRKGETPRVKPTESEMDDRDKTEKRTRVKARSWNKTRKLWEWKRERERERERKIEMVYTRSDAESPTWRPAENGTRHIARLWSLALTSHPPLPLLCFALSPEVSLILAYPSVPVRYFNPLPFHPSGLQSFARGGTSCADDLTTQSAALQALLLAPAE